MWIIGPIGVFSIVEKGGKKGQLCIRARDGADLDALRDSYLPSLGPTVANEGTDYPFRAWASRKAVAKAMSDAVLDIDYSNVKDEVWKRQGPKREGVLHKVWAALLSLEPPRVHRPLWDDWDEEPLWGYEPGTLDCGVCGEAVPVYDDELSEDLSPEEAEEEVRAIRLAIARECEYNDTGRHYGRSIEEELAA